MTRLSDAELIRERRVGRSRLVSANPGSRYTRPLAELVTLAFGPRLVIGEEFRSLDAIAVAIYGSWAARYQGVVGHAPRDVDVLVIGEVPRRDLYEAAERAEQRLGLPVNPVVCALTRWLAGRLATDHGISCATAYRYVTEAIDVLSAQAPGLDEALRRALADGAPYVILDGKIFETDRLTETVTSAKGEDTDAWYSGKKHYPGARQKGNHTVATVTVSRRAPLDDLGIPLPVRFCGQPQAKVKLDLAVAAGIPAKSPFDDATNKSVIKLLPRKPPAIKERSGCSAGSAKRASKRTLPRCGKNIRSY